MKKCSTSLFVVVSLKQNRNLAKLLALFILLFASKAEAQSPCSSINQSLNVTGSGAAQSTLVSNTTDNFTLELWVKFNPNSPEGYQSLYYNGNSGGTGFGIYTESSGLAQILIGGIGWVNTNIYLTPGTWQHLAIVRKSGTWYSYLNGVEYVTNDTTSPNTPIDTTSIGCNIYGDEKFNGTVSSVAFWNSVRTTSQIQADMQACSFSGSDLAAYWSLNGTASDLSGNEHNLTIINASYSAIVSVNTTTKVRASQCGVTLAALNTDVMADFFLGATDYRFKVVANGATEIIERGNRRYFNLTALTTISAAYNTSYTISVSVKKNGAWGSFGTECIVATPLPPITKVKAIQCGATLAALNTDIQADWLQFATAYRFKVVDWNGNIEVIERPYRYFNLTALTAGARYSYSYTISVAVQHNGFWGDYGTACMVYTPDTPVTKVQATQCGATLAALNTDILADWLQFAAAYRFKVIVNGASYIVNPVGNRRYFKLTALPISVTAGTEYIISVAAQFNGVWSDYATECYVRTPINSSNVRQIVETTDFNLVAYPNPSNSAFNLQINGSNNETVSVLVFDMTGRQIENKVLDATAIENIKLGQNYSAGIYNVIVSQGMNTKTLRLVKN